MDWLTRLSTEALDRTSLILLEEEGLCCNKELRYLVLRCGYKLGLVDHAV